MKLAITGAFRRGKDTVANIVISSLLTDRPVTRLAFADALKRELSEMVFDYAVEVQDQRGRAERLDSWDTHMRRMRKLNGIGWQWWGEYRRQVDGPDYWIEHPDLKRNYEQAEREGHHIIITDMRHHNETSWCRSHGFYCVRVEGPCREVEETRHPDHASEVDIPYLLVHDVINNRGSLRDLKRRVSELIDNGHTAFIGLTQCL